MLISFNPSLPCNISTREARVLPRIVFEQGILGSILNPVNYWFKKPYCFGWGMLLPNCQICYSCIVYDLFCHCLMHVERVYRFRVQVVVVMCTFVIWDI
jgi:hypothetical protein